MHPEQQGNSWPAHSLWRIPATHVIVGAPDAAAEGYGEASGVVDAAHLRPPAEGPASKEGGEKPQEEADEYIDSDDGGAEGENCSTRAHGRAPREHGCDGWEGCSFCPIQSPGGAPADTLAPLAFPSPPTAHTATRTWAPHGKPGGEA